MKKYFEILKKCRLFDNINAENMAEVVNVMDGSIRSFKKGEYVFRTGDNISRLCILVEGALHIQREDYWGHINIITDILPGEVFGETYAYLKNVKTTVNVEAIKDSKVFMGDINSIIEQGVGFSDYKNTIMKNFISTIAEKNIQLNNKLRHISAHSIREKIISYLSYISKKEDSAVFDIPFNRQQLADYLNTDRSALSAELCRMRDEGILEFKKNHFVLKD